MKFLTLNLPPPPGARGAYRRAGNGTTSPLSYRDYTGTIDGSAYGIVKNYQYPQISFVSTRTKLKNLFLTGQNLNVHGALGVTLTAMLTCSEFVGQEYLAKKVGNA